MSIEEIVSKLNDLAWGPWMLLLLVVIVGAALKLDLVWNIADTLNGFMAIPNLIALLGLSGVVIRLTREHFAK